MSRFDQLPIRRKLTWIILSICGIVLLLTAGAFAAYEVFEFRQTLTRDAGVLADFAANNVSGALAFEDEEAARISLQAFRSDEHVVAAALYKEDGSRFATYVRGSARHDFPPQAGPEGAVFESGTLTVVRPVWHEQRRLGSIYLRMDLLQLRERLLMFGGIVLLVLLAAVGIAAALSSWLQRPITGPILQLAETARRISEKKDFTVRAHPGPGGEIGALTGAFNEMLANIEQSRSALLGEVQERQQAEQRANAHAARLAQLNQITRAIAERQDVESVFQTVLGSLEEQLPVDVACVCLYEEAREALTVAAVGARGHALAEKMELTRATSLRVDQNGLSRCVRGVLVYEPDVLQSGMAFPRRIAAAGLRSLVLAPLLVESRVFGVLITARRAANAFTSGDCEFLKQLSEHVALAAHQTQLYAALQRAYDDLRQTQQAVMQQERLRALGQMASGIAHDINNAISPISIYIEAMLEKERGLSAQSQERLTIVQRAIDDVAHTVSRMRDFYRQRPEEVTLVRVNLNKLADQVVDLTKARWFDMPQNRGVVIELRRELDPELPLVKGVEGEIREALTNLIFNAVDAMPKGGVLSVVTRKLVRPAGGGTDTAEPRVGIEVTDSGMGMSEETLRRCLEPFFTTKGERGSGLGLAMVYGIAKRHGGEIELESEPGQGTTVRLLFPVAVGRETLVDTPPQPVPARLRLLLVDDDPMLIKSVGEILDADGHAVTTASSGQDGINKFTDAAHGAHPFDAVITDLGMPYVDGRRVATAVKAIAPDTPVFLLTGWGQRLAAEGEVPPEVDRILSKPPKLRELRQVLSTVKPVAVSHE